MDDRALMREIIHSLVSDASTQIEELRLAIERGDTRECRRLAHSLTGACGNVGAVSMAALFFCLERQAARGNVSACRPAIDCLTDELEKLRRAADSI